MSDKTNEILLKSLTAMANSIFESYKPEILKENEKLRSCVEFYADRNNWGEYKEYTTLNQDADSCSFHTYQGRKLARKTLEEIDKTKG